MLSMENISEHSVLNYHKETTMNGFKRSLLGLAAALAFTGLPADAAKAEKVCDNCPAFHPYGRHIGGYWPKDYGTFTDTRLRQWGDQNGGGEREFDAHWIFDVNQNGTIVITGTTPIATQVLNFGAELYTDAGTVCDPVYCLPIALGEVLVTKPGPTLTWTIRKKLVPGRYVIRVFGTIPGTGARGYTGKIQLKKN